MAQIQGSTFSSYDDTAHVGQQVRDGRHREIIGGLWEELGELQKRFLIAHGLLPQHGFIDVGAGSFRAGVKLIPYLDPGNYHAIDAQAALLEAGYAKEIEPAGLEFRFTRGNYAVTSDFDVSGFGRVFEFGIAQSVFTHMPLRRLADCLVTLAPYFATSGRFFVTVFLGSDTDPGKPCVQIPGVTSHPDRDPYHTSITALHEMSARVPGWQMAIFGDWNHPRNQQMLCFTRI